MVLKEGVFSTLLKGADVIGKDFCRYRQHGKCMSVLNATPLTGIEMMIAHPIKESDHWRAGV